MALFGLILLIFGDDMPQLKKRTDILIAVFPPDENLAQMAAKAVFRQSASPKIYGRDGTLTTAGIVLIIIQPGADLGEAQRFYAQAGGIKRHIFAAEGQTVPFATTTPYQDVISLRAAIVDTLSPYRESDLAVFHNIIPIPEPPKAYVAHPYTLLPSTYLAGRADEIILLNKWFTDLTPEAARIMNVVAIGGMGKSAMTWKWYEQIAPTLRDDIAGSVWWSFYESDATFENFVVRTLAYLTKTPQGEIRELSIAEREQELLETLDTKPYLIVLDGIERMMLAYARLDAARMDDEALDETTANRVAGAIGMPEDAAPSMFSPNRLRKTADPRAGAFLRKLTRVDASRILISSRLYPAELQLQDGYPLAGSLAMFLTGIGNSDALALWRSFGCTGEDAELLAIFNRFDNYPLIIRALAGEVSSFGPAPMDFGAWRAAHPGFDPLSQPVEQVKSHVMSYALSGLSKSERQTLDLIASFRIPSNFDALAHLLVNKETADGDGATPMGAFERDSQLDAALTVLERRGLMGWDAPANRYDLHPIVRGVAWSALDSEAKKGLYYKLNAHFGALPAVSMEDVKSLDDLTATIETYNTQIGLEEYDEAFALYSQRLDIPMQKRLSANLQRIELLEVLFKHGLKQPPVITDGRAQGVLTNMLATAYHASGQPGTAAELYVRANTLAERDNMMRNVVVGLCNLSDALRHSGALHAANLAADRALLISRAIGDEEGEVFALMVLGLARGATGILPDAQAAFQRAYQMVQKQGDTQRLGVCYAHMAQIALWASAAPEEVRAIADEAWKLANHTKFESDYVRAAVLQGMGALGMKDHTSADERLSLALSRARAANLVEFELAALIGLAELDRRRANRGSAFSRLDDVWEQAERGPYRLLHADAYYVLAMTLHDEGGKTKDSDMIEQSVQVARGSYYLSWCEGAPYAYGYGLGRAEKLLVSWGQKAPDDVPPFDTDKNKNVMPVEINPAPRK
jgi:tetratricopeptide (TPR) repeat protein